MKVRMLALALTTLALAAAGCGGSGAVAVGSMQEEEQALTAAQAAPLPEGRTLRLKAYFVRGERLAPVTVRVRATRAVAAAAMRALLAGPKARGLTTAVPQGTRLLGISVRGGVARVDLSAEYESGGGSLSMSMRLAQVVFTMTQFPSIRAVTFALDGHAVSVFSGEGIILGHPVGRADYRDLAPR